MILGFREGELCHKTTTSHIFSSPEPKAHGELIVYQSSRRLLVRAHEKTLSEYTWNSVHRLPHTHAPSKFLRFIVNENHNGINLICIFKGNYKR